VSARINDRPYPPFSLVSAPHLPLVGELHPLRREFEKWLAAGNLVTLFVATAIFAVGVLWQRTHVDAPVPPGPRTTHRIQPPPTPRQIRPEEPGPFQAGGPSRTNAQPDPVPGPVDPNTVFDPRVVPGDTGPGEDPFDGIDSLVFEPRDEEPREVYTPFDREPVLLHIDAPVYPEMVRDAGIDGTVLVKVFVGADGRVKEARAFEGRAVLYEAALASARTARFEPALQGTRPVAVWVVIPVTFRLHGRE
jgi:protein TonB